MPAVVLPATLSSLLVGWPQSQHLFPRGTAAGHGLPWLPHRPWQSLCDILVLFAKYLNTWVLPFLPRSGLPALLPLPVGLKAPLPFPGPQVSRQPRAAGPAGQVSQQGFLSCWTDFLFCHLEMSPCVMLLNRACAGSVDRCETAASGVLRLAPARRDSLRPPRSA